MNRQSGQALVLVLLSLAVVLTLVLFILSRSVTDILVSSKSEEAARAFSAAEAGIEQALVIGTGGTNSNIGNNAGYETTVAPFGEGSSFNYPTPMYSGDTITMWFVGHDDEGNEVCGGGSCFTGNRITLCWGRDVDTLSNFAPAIEFSLFYERTPGDPSTVTIARAAFDPNSSRAASLNNFDGIDGACSGVDGEEYAFEKNINLFSLLLPGTPGGTEGALRFARIRMLYNTDKPHFVGVTASGDVFPSQGINVVSTGTAGTSTRKVAVFQSWPEVPSVFDYSVFSSSGIVK